MDIVDLTYCFLLVWISIYCKAVAMVTVYIFLNGLWQLLEWFSPTKYALHVWSYLFIFMYIYSSLCKLSSILIQTHFHLSFLYNQCSIPTLWNLFYTSEVFETSLCYFTLLHMITTVVFIATGQAYQFSWFLQLPCC